MEKPSLLSAPALSFMGDAVYTILVREKLCQTNRPSKELHELSVKLVNAKAQAEAFKIVEPILTEKELEIYKRGRNMHSSSLPKGASSAIYHCATGIETLFGYLYLDKNDSRIKELFEIIWESFLGNN